MGPSPERIKMSSYYRYACPPIDYFDGCMTVEQHFANKTAGDDGQVDLVAIITDLHLLVREMHSMPTWEGDVTEGPFIFSLPDPHRSIMEIGFVWKQENNGTTFVLSPFQLPWLTNHGVV